MFGHFFKGSLENQNQAPFNNEEKAWLGLFTN
jgi:hypothetical protein